MIVSVYLFTHANFSTTPPPEKMVLSLAYRRHFLTSKVDHRAVRVIHIYNMFRLHQLEIVEKSIRKRVARLAVCYW